MIFNLMLVDVEKLKVKIGKYGRIGKHPVHPIYKVLPYLVIQAARRLRKPHAHTDRHKL